MRRMRATMAAALACLLTISACATTGDPGPGSSPNPNANITALIIVDDFGVNDADNNTRKDDGTCAHGGNEFESYGGTSTSAPGVAHGNLVATAAAQAINTKLGQNEPLVVQV